MTVSRIWEVKCDFIPGKECANLTIANKNSLDGKCKNVLHFVDLEKAKGIRNAHTVDGKNMLVRNVTH